MADGADGPAGAAEDRRSASRGLLLQTGDRPVRRRLRQLAEDHGLTVTETAPGAPEGPAAPEGPGGSGGVPGGSGGGEPAVAVIDLDLPGALERIREWRARWPGALLAGYLAVPDRERWVAAQRAGCDLVSNRGAVVLRLRELLASRAPGSRAFPLFDAADAAGRLGLVFRATDTPAGPVAVYRVAGRLHAIADRCPHAGAALSEGGADGTVLTCPRHGSRFDICTGERLRGPADTDIAVFPLAEKGGQICLMLRS